MARQTWIEDCIYRTPGGKYMVKVRINTVYSQRTFRTLTEARKYRREVIKARPKERLKQMNNWKDRAREQIKAAPRSKVVIDGRKWTVVHLPPGPVERISWADVSRSAYAEALRSVAA